MHPPALRRKADHLSIRRVKRDDVYLVIDAATNRSLPNG